MKNDPHPPRHPTVRSVDASLYGRREAELIPENTRRTKGCSNAQRAEEAALPPVQGGTCGAWRKRRRPFSRPSPSSARPPSRRERTPADPSSSPKTDAIRVSPTPNSLRGPLARTQYNLSAGWDGLLAVLLSNAPRFGSRNPYPERANMRRHAQQAAAAMPTLDASRNLGGLERSLSSETTGRTA